MMGWFDTPFLPVLNWLSETPLETAQRRGKAARRDLEVIQRGDRYASRVVEQWNFRNSLYGSGFGSCPPGCQCGRLR